MKKIYTAFGMLMILLSIIAFSCQKQLASTPAGIKIENDLPISPLQAMVNTLKSRCDSLSLALSRSTSVAATLKADLNAVQPGPGKINVDSLKKQVAGFLSQLSTLNNNLASALTEIATINTQVEATNSNTEIINNQVNNGNAKISQIDKQLNTLTGQLQSAQTLAESALGSKTYIAAATADHARIDEGDVIPVPGHYLAAYIRYNTVTNDIGPTTLMGKMSTDTTGKIWGSEFVISLNIGVINVMCPSLHRVDANNIDCYFVVKNSTADTRVFVTRSPDNGVTWGLAHQVIYENAYDILNNAIVHTVNNGRIVISIASVPVFTKIYTFSDYCFYSDNSGSSWHKSATITPQITHGGLEPEVVQLSGDTCLMNLRTQTGFQYFSISTDNCETWGPAYQSTLINPFADAEIVNVGGKLIAVHNYRQTTTNTRNPMSISTSLDKGKTWKHVMDIETGNPDIYGWSYPSVTISNGYLLLSYYETVNMPAPISSQYYSLKFNKIKISSLF